jgi:hypothetical protein
MVVQKSIEKEYLSYQNSKLRLKLPNSNFNLWGSSILNEKRSPPSQHLRAPRSPLLPVH